jgi:hypothetical protein
MSALAFCALVIAMIHPTFAVEQPHNASIQAENVTIASDELSIRLADIPVTGYIMVLLSNEVESGWQGGIMVALDVGEIVYYVIDDLVSGDWQTDISGSHHVLSGMTITFIFPEFALNPDTSVAVLSILSGHYDWMPDEYENSEDFVPFEQFTDGLSTIPGMGAGSSGSGSTGTTSDTSSSTDTTSTSSSTDSRSSTSSTSSKSSTGTSSTDVDTTNDTPSLNLDFSFSFAIISMLTITMITAIVRKNTKIIGT